MSGPVRVCHVFTTLQTGGAERLFVEAARHVDPERVRYEFVCLGGGGAPMEELRGAGIPVTDLGIGGRVPARSTMKRLFDHFRGRNFDVCHTHNTLPGFVAAGPAKRAGVPVVVNTQHGRGCGKNWQSRVKFLLANRRTDVVIGVSDDAKVLCQGQDPISARKIRRIWNAVDVNRFEYAGPSLPEETGVHHAVSVARLSPEKDFGTLLRAVAIVKDRRPTIRLTLIGDGGERAGLKRLAEELCVTDVVTFAGERHDIPQQLAKAGFFVSSSRSEGISLTLLEAMGVGLPIVTTRVGGNPEIVVEGETGMLVPSENPLALAEAIDRMCGASGRWTAMGRAGRERVVAHFSMDRMVGLYEDVYREFLGKRR